MRKWTTRFSTSLIAAVIAAHVGLVSSARAQSAEVPFSDFDELDGYAQRLTEENSFSGVVLVAKDGKPIFHKAYGLASKNFHVPNRLDTKFNIGSLNKISH